MGVSDAKRCKGVSKLTGKRCRQPAMTGADVCRLHTGLYARAAGVDGRKPHKTKRGAPPENTNARTHGASSPRLLPEEEPIFEAKRKEFTEALGATDAFDREILRLLALISTKVDVAVMSGAEHSAYGGMIKQILDLMKELKATRASRDPVADGPALTYADLVEALRARVVNPPAPTEATGDATGSEPSAVPEPAGAQDPAVAPCARCGATTAPTPAADGRLCCQNCGLVTGDAVAEATPAAQALQPAQPVTSEEGAHP